MSTRSMMSAAAAVVLLAACGGGGMSPEEYYAAAEAAAVTYDDQTDAIFDGYREAVAAALEDFQERTSPDVETETLVEETARLLDITVAEITDAFEQAEVALQAFVSEFEELDPPSEIEDEHDEALAALQRSLDSIPDLIDALVEADSLASVSETINASSFGDTQPRLAAACRELEAAAAGFGVDADLRCGSDEDS